MRMRRRWVKVTMKTAKEKKEEKQQALQNTIFDAATALIKEYGYEQVTVRMICEAAGISIGMFYRNFKSKNDVLSYFYDKAVEAYETNILESIKDLPAEKQLIEFYVWLTKFTAGLGGGFVQQFYTPGYNAIKSDTIDNEVVSIGCGLVQAAEEDGRLTLAPGRTAWNITHDFLIIVKGILLDWYVSGSNYNSEAYARELIEKFAPIILETAAK